MHTIYMDTFGKRLKKLREEKKKSQQDLADHLGKGNKTVISSWELDKTKPSMDDIVSLSLYFETTTDYLMKGILSNTLQEPSNEYVTISKDELLQLKDKLIQYQEKEIQELREKEQNLKNISVVRTEV